MIEKIEYFTRAAIWFILLSAFAFIFQFAHYSLSPVSHFYIVEEFVPQDIEYGSTEQIVRLHRTASDTLRASTIKELKKLIREGDEIILQGHLTIYNKNIGIEVGESTIELIYPLQGDEPRGTYIWIINGELELPYGIVRQYEYHSDKFKIY